MPAARPFPDSASPELDFVFDSETRVAETLAAISRELKKPLHLISAQAQLLAAQRHDDPDVVRAANAILRESANQNRLLCRFLEGRLPNQNRGLETSRPPVAVDLRNVRVLLVDDCVDALETFALLLAVDGLVVETCSTAAEAIDALRTRPFDVLVSDIDMPGMNGYELLRVLRQERHAAGLPAIALTGRGRSEDVQRAYEAGFVAHLDKPADHVRLECVIGELLANPRQLIPRS